MQRSIVHMRNIQWELVVPLGLEWKFMEEFSKSFLRAVDDYFEHADGWHIKVTVHENEESALSNFCQDFFGSREITFIAPETALTARPAESSATQKTAWEDVGTNDPDEVIGAGLQ